MKHAPLNSSRQRRRATGRAHGFTLLEILVVLVILLIGIMSILRLFPGGFLTIRRTGEQTLAQGLAAQQLDVQKNLVSIPEAILPVAIDTDGSFQVLADMHPNDLSPLSDEEIAKYNLPAQFALPEFRYYLSDINRFRYIVGENVRIPVPTANAVKGYGSVYILQQGPVFNAFGADSDGDPTDGIDVYSAPLERIEQSSMDQGPLTGEPIPNIETSAQYAIDYENLRIAFHPRVTGRTFRINYDYYAAPSQTALPTVRSILNYELAAVNNSVGTPDERPQWQPLFPNGTPPQFQSLKLNSETVNRRFRLVSNTPASAGGGTPPNFSPVDPYEYAWYSEQIGLFGNVGVLIFNPRAHDFQEQTSLGTRPLTARIDYATMDNHILREDRSLSASAPYVMKLSVPFVLTNGDILPDQTAYNGLFRQTNQATPDVLIYNVNTGEKVGEYISGTGTMAPGGAGFALDAKAGLLTMNETDVANNALQNATLRVFYRSEGDWGMQVQKANARYTRSEDITGVTYRNYYYKPTGNSSAFGRPWRVYFRVSEAGKTVVLGEYYVMDENGQVQRFANESFQINENPAFFESFNGTPYTFIYQKAAHPEAEQLNWQFTDLPTGQAIRNIQGTSIKSRVVWRSAERWRKVDANTFLTPPPAQ